MRSLMLCLLLACATAQAESPTLEKLLRAAKNGDASVVVGLIERGAWLDTVDIDGNSLLMQAIAVNENGLADILINAGAQLEIRNRVGDTALMLAAINGNEAMASRLLENGARPDQAGWSAIHYAAFSGHEKIVATLRDYSADPDALAPNGATALMLAFPRTWNVPVNHGRRSTVTPSSAAATQANLRVLLTSTWLQW